VAAAAGLGALLFVIAGPISGGALDGVDRDLRATYLLAINEDPTRAAVVPAVLQAVAVLLMGVPVFYLYEAARNRSSQVRSQFRGLYFLGPVLVAAGIVMAALAIISFAEDFAGDYPELAAQVTDGSVEDVDVEEESAAEDDAEDSPAPAGVFVQLAGSLAFGVALFYAGRWGMRTGLLSRFNGSFAMALGVVWALSLVFGDLALLVTAIWMAFLAVFFFRSIESRPPAWAEGRAVPWPAPGEERAEPADGTVEGSGREVLEKPLPESDAPASAETPAAPEDESPAGESQGQRRKKRKRRS
jgi:hypothetical protein